MSAIQTKSDQLAERAAKKASDDAERAARKAMTPADRDAAKAAEKAVKLAEREAIAKKIAVNRAAFEKTPEGIAQLKERSDRQSAIDTSNQWDAPQNSFWDDFGSDRQALFDANYDPNDPNRFDNLTAVFGEGLRDTGPKGLTDLLDVMRSTDWSDRSLNNPLAPSGDPFAWNPRALQIKAGPNAPEAFSDYSDYLFTRRNTGEIYNAGFDYSRMDEEGYTGNDAFASKVVFNGGSNEVNEGSLLSTWLQENNDNLFAQYGFFKVDHLVSDVGLAKEIIDAGVGSKIPSQSRAEFLNPIVSSSGLSTVTEELISLAQQFIDVSEVGIVSDITDTSGGFLGDNASAIGGILGAMTGFGSLGAAIGSSFGTMAAGGDVGDALKAGALSYFGGEAGGAFKGALNAAPQGSLLGNVASGINTVGNFLDPIIPDFIKAPGDIFARPAPETPVGTTFGNNPGIGEGALNLPGSSDLLVQAKDLVDGGLNANSVISSLVEANPGAPIEELIAAANEAAGIGIPGNGVIGSPGNVSQFTGKAAGAGPGALNTSIATGGPGAASQAFEAAQDLVASGKNANEVVAELVDQGVEVKTAIDAANEAANVGIPGNGIQGDPGNVSQFTGLPAGAGTGAVNTTAATGGNQVSETSDLFDTVSDLASLIGDLTGVVGTVTGAKAGGDAADAAGDAIDSQTDIANRLAQISEEQWAIWKEDYRPFSKASAATQLALLPDYEEAQRTSLQAITDDREYYLDEIRPIEQQMAEEAQPQYDYVTSLAAADADQAQQRAIDITERNLQRAGIDPNSGRWQAEVNQNFAGTRAGMINAARERERTTSFDKKALVTGRGAVNRNGNATAPGVNQAISPSQATTGFSNAASQFGNVANSQYGQEQVYAGGAGDSAGAVTYSNNSTGGVLGAVQQGLGAIQTVGNIYDAGKSVYNAGKSIYDGVSGFFGFEDGGMIPEISTMNPAQRGAISVPGYPVGPTDTVPGMIVGANGETANAMLAPGEVVIPEEIVRAKGTDFFEKLLNPKTASRAI